MFVVLRQNRGILCIELRNIGLIVIRAKYDFESVVQKLFQ